MKSILFFFILCGFLLQAQSQINEDSGLFKQIDSLNKTAASFEKDKKLGMLYYKTGHYNKALFHLQKARAKKDDIKLNKSLAKVWEAKGYPEKAATLWEEIVKKDTTDLENQFRLAKIYIRLNRKNEAMQMIKKLEQKDPGNPWYPYQRAKLTDDSLNKKLDAYLSAYRKDTTWLNTIYPIAQLYNIIKFYDSTRIFIQKGLKLRPAHSGLLKLKALEEFRQGKNKKALKTLQKMDSMHQKPFFVKKNLGIGYYKIKDYPKALEYFDQALAIEPTDPDSYLYKGLIYENQNKTEEAVKMFNASIAFKHKKLDTEYYHLGKLAQKKKNYKKALDYLLKAYKENPKNTAIFFEWALLSDRYYKDKKIALKRYEKYLNLKRWKNEENEQFARERIKEIKTRLFMKEKK